MPQIIRSLTRAALRGAQSIGARLGNRGWAPRPHSNAHDLLKSKWLSTYIEDGSRVLDVGCGNGQRLHDLSLFVRDLDAHGVELYPSATIKTFIPDSRAPDVRVFDGERLHLDDASFDVAMICYVLHHLETTHAERLLTEVIRTTRARLLVLEDSRPTFGLPYRLRNWAHATEANLGYATESDHFKQNLNHTMFKTHGGWRDFFASLDRVERVECVPLDAISRYRHHTLFVIDLAP